eukprot:NODE_468_length_7060_cov_0.310157.p3 type:complete len:292 gc:universal NODE_468_length_7060_cov_0.310157:6751-5876(-)
MLTFFISLLIAVPNRNSGVIVSDPKLISSSLTNMPFDKENEQILVDQCNQIIVSAHYKVTGNVLQVENSIPKISYVGLRFLPLEDLKKAQHCFSIYVSVLIHKSKNERHLKPFIETLLKATFITSLTSSNNDLLSIYWYKFGRRMQFSNLIPIVTADELRSLSIDELHKVVSKLLDCNTSAYIYYVQSYEETKVEEKEEDRYEIFLNYYNPINDIYIDKLSKEWKNLWSSRNQYSLKRFFQKLKDFSIRFDAKTPEIEQEIKTELLAIEAELNEKKFTQINDISFFSDSVV